MIGILRTMCVSLAAVGLACAGGSAGSGSAAPDFEPTGGIVVASGNGARFTATQVVGPKIQVSRRSDGTWGGVIVAGGSNSSPTPIDATFQHGQLVGSNIRLNITREAGQTTILGSCLDRIVRIEVNAAEIRVQTGSRSEHFVKLPDPGSYGGRQTVTLEGEAQQAPPTPAFALAMLGAFI